MTEERRAEIEAMLAAITPGTWEWHDDRSTLVGFMGIPVIYLHDQGYASVVIDDDDARIIATAPAIIRELLMALRAAQSPA